MSRTTGHLDATFYAQVEPEWSSYVGVDGEQALRKVKAVRMTLSRPGRPKPGTVLVKLTLRIPAAAFYPLRPEAIVVVPESLTEAMPIEVVAEDPHAPGEGEYEGGM